MRLLSSKPISIFFLLLLFVATATAAKSSPIGAHRLDQMIGNTVVGATAKSSIWSVYLDPDGSAEFQLTSGTRLAAKWMRFGDATLCFSYVDEYGVQQSLCKVIAPAGQGVHWRTSTERTASSQILMVLPGRNFADQASYERDTRNWAGKIIVGRVLGTGSIWHALFRHDGQVDFYHASGRQDRGAYFMYGDTICMRFWTTDLTHCRRPTVSNGKIGWVNVADNSHVSEVVYLHGLERPVAARPALRRSSSNRPRCSRKQLDDYRAACVVIGVGELACASTLSSMMTKSGENGAAAAGMCSVAAQKLQSGNIDPSMVGLASGLGMLSGAGARMTEDNPDSFWGALFQLGAVAGSVGLIANCVEQVSDRCR